MEKILKFSSTTINLANEDIDTDQIVPARFLTLPSKEGIGDCLFYDWRFDKLGHPIEDFVLNKPEAKNASILVAGNNFGCGSSREHAAMEPRHLGVRAVLVKSFARIHETNLKKQGMLALTFSNDSDYDKIQENDSISIKGLTSFASDEPLTIELSHSDGSTDEFLVNHTYNDQQIEWFKAGGALNIIRASVK